MNAYMFGVAQTIWKEISKWWMECAQEMNDDEWRKSPKCMQQQHDGIAHQSYITMSSIKRYEIQICASLYLFRGACVCVCIFDGRYTMHACREGGGGETPREKLYAEREKCAKRIGVSWFVFGLFLYDLTFLLFVTRNDLLDLLIHLYFYMSKITCAHSLAATIIWSSLCHRVLECVCARLCVCVFAASDL